MRQVHSSLRNLFWSLAAAVALLTVASCTANSNSASTNAPLQMAELKVGECPDDLTSFVDGTVKVNGATVKADAKAWEWAKDNCGDQKGSPDSPAATDPGSTQPIIERLPIDIALIKFGFNLDDKMMRAGPIVSVGSQSDNGATHKRPEITFQFLPLGTGVFAVSTGVVLEVSKQSDSCDNAIIVVNSGEGKGAAWSVEYDHVRDVRVEPGSAVAPGQRIGSVGSLFGCRDDNAGVGSVELMVKNKDNAVCPYKLMKSDLADKTRTTVRNLMIRWNKTRPGTYPDDTLAGAGCLTDVLGP